MDTELLQGAANAVVESDSLEAITRPLLELLNRMTGISSTYLTAVREDEGEQEILFAKNDGEIEVPEGLIADREDTLCKRALISGIRYTPDVPSV